MTLYFDLILPEEGYAKNMAIDEVRDLSPNEDGGVMKKLTKHGHGKDYPNAGDKVTLKYVAYKGDVLAPEYIFDSSEKDGKPFVYSVMRGRVVRGFELAVMSMVEGEQAVITLKPEYAFGQSGSPPKVPAGVNVTFDTTIEKIECPDFSPDKDRTFLRKTLVAGKGWDTPNEGCILHIHIKGWYDDDVVFQDAEVKFPLGEGTSKDYNVPKFVEDLLDHWKKDEVARLNIAAKNAFGAEGNADFGVPPNKDLVYVVKLINFERQRDIWEMNNTEKMNQSEMYKDKGNKYYKKREYELALKFYERMLDFIEYDLCMEGEEEHRRHRIMVVGYLNKAQVCLNLGKNLEARRVCEKVIDFDNRNVKAYFRRGQSFVNTKDWGQALADFEKVVELDPDNKAARNHILICKQRIKEQSSGDKDLAQKMMSGIGRFGGDDQHMYDSGMNDIGNWDNSMAHGMITLEQEREAFGEDMPPRGGNNHGNEDED